MKITETNLRKMIKEELAAVLQEDTDDIMAKIEALYTPEALSPGTRIVATLKMKLGELGFEEGDMNFQEDYPASLSFGNSWDDLGEWVLPLEGKRVGQLREI